ncbi:MAG: diacylglycerol kinase family protein [Bacteroidia bacterium]|nr:diacylglycerol kinase family protein [Bacteroidia bacterium]
MSSNKFSLKSRFRSFRFAFNGLWSLLKNEHNSRIHFLVAIVAIALGIILKVTIFEWSLLTMVIGIVFLTELLNSSLETLADFIDPEWNEQIRKAKDYAAAAVLISAIISVVVGGLIFIPKVILFLST